jgi:hypothetical protein
VTHVGDALAVQSLACASKPSSTRVVPTRSGSPFRTLDDALERPHFTAATGETRGESCGSYSSKRIILSGLLPRTVLVLDEYHNDEKTDRHTNSQAYNE